MVDPIPDEKSIKRPSFKKCKFFDCEFSCNGVQQILGDNNAFTRKKVLHDFLRVSYQNLNNVCDINIESSKFSDDSTIFTVYAYCNDRACCTFIFKLYFGDEICKVFHPKEELQH